LGASSLIFIIVIIAGLPGFITSTITIITITAIVTTIFSNLW
jgi:hypothetical protein